MAADWWAKAETGEMEESEIKTSWQHALHSRRTSTTSTTRWLKSTAASDSWSSDPSPPPMPALPTPPIASRLWRLTSDPSRTACSYSKPQRNSWSSGSVLLPPTRDQNPVRQLQSSMIRRSSDTKTKTDPIPWFRKFELKLQLHHVSEHKHHAYLYSRSGGACQAWLDNLLSKYGVVAADLHTMISWDDLKAAWHKRFQVEPPEIKAMDKLMTFEQGTLPSVDWIAEYQLLTSIPDIQMSFKVVKHYFISRSCTTLGNALTHVEDTLTTTAELFDKAAQIIVTNKEAKNLHRSSAAGLSRDQHQPKVAVVAAATPTDQISEAVSAYEGDRLAAARDGGHPGKGRGRSKAKTNTASSPGPGATAPSPWSHHEEERDIFVAKLASSTPDPAEKEILLQEKKAELHNKMVAAKRQEFEEKKRLKEMGERFQQQLQEQKEKQAVADERLSLLTDTLLHTNKQLAALSKQVQKVEHHQFVFEGVWDSFLQRSAQEVDKHIIACVEKLDEQISKRLSNAAVVKKLVAGGGGDGGDGDGDGGDGDKKKKGVQQEEIEEVRKIKVKVPWTYTGKKEESVLHWIAAVESYVYGQHIPYWDRVLMASSCMVGDAMSFAISWQKEAGCASMVEFSQQTRIEDFFKVVRERSRLASCRPLLQVGSFSSISLTGSISRVSDEAPNEAWGSQNVMAMGNAREQSDLHTSLGTGVSWRHFHGREMKATSSPGRLTLAGSRTKRPNPLDNFKDYTEGWDLNKKDYIASALFTGAPGYGMSAVWILWTVLKLLYKCVQCCRRRDSEVVNEPKPTQLTILTCVVLVCILITIVACALTYSGQKKFKEEFWASVDVAVNKTEEVLGLVKNVGQLLGEAEKIPVISEKLGPDLLGSQQKLEEKSENVRKEVTNTKTEGHNWERIIMIVVLAVISFMLVVFALMITFLVARLETLVSISSFFGSLSTIIGFLMFGICLAVYNTTGDTCLAMKEYSEQPQADSAFKDLIPCIPKAEAEATMTNLRQVIYTSVIDINGRLVHGKVNDPSGKQLVICNPVGPPPEYNRKTDCDEGEVGTDNISVSGECVTGIAFNKTICDSDLANIASLVLRIDDLYPQLELWRLLVPDAIALRTSVATHGHGLRCRRRGKLERVNPRCTCPRMAVLHFGGCGRTIPSGRTSLRGGGGGRIAGVSSLWSRRWWRQVGYGGHIRQQHVVFRHRASFWTSRRVRCHICAVEGLRKQDFLAYGVRKHVVLRVFLEKGFPKCHDAVDCTHIYVDKPANAPSENYFDRKHCFSVVAQVVVDLGLRVLDLFVGYPRSCHDIRVIQLSSLSWCAEDGTMFHGPPVMLSGGMRTNGYILGDNGYPPSEWVVVPYGGINQPPDEERFDTKQNVTREAVERAFGRWKGMWRLFLRAHKTNLDTLPQQFTVVCILHSILLDAGIEFDENLLWEVDTDGVRHRVDLGIHLPPQPVINSTSTTEAITLRNALTKRMKHM
ncbi:hypothetical protein CBR_g39150 [Chara braunii]|uniref:DDE Tnp4 domain-containing protein n=1 Tax=Chara braunii TaxID=69332 RepID=A0A388LRC6_CHABU|nr:hypothetical protein CBR_g39150 [Chara braunii]|eukprot:GBG84773.1 hypothetical protein CBR_g39150 [Chara braunii]